MHSSSLPMTVPIEKGVHCSRRNLLKGLAFIIASGMFSPLLQRACAESEPQRILITYFSHTGNTKTVAQQIQALTGGDMLELRTVHPYPSDHADTVHQAEQEKADNARPVLSTQFPVMDKYSIIFVGYPVWVYTMPMALYAFFDRYTFPAKTIVPFSTHLGSGLADGPEQIARLCPQAKVLKGLAIRGNSVGESQENVTRWLRQLHMVKG